MPKSTMWPPQRGCVGPLAKGPWAIEKQDAGHPVDVSAVVAQTSKGQRVPGFLSVFGVLGCFPLVSGQVSYPPGPILESVFLWRVSVDRNLRVLLLFSLELWGGPSLAEPGPGYNGVEPGSQVEPPKHNFVLGGLSVVVRWGRGHRVLAVTRIRGRPGLFRNWARPGPGYSGGGSGGGLKRWSF